MQSVLLMQHCYCHEPWKFLTSAYARMIEASLSPLCVDFTSTQLRKIIHIHEKLSCPPSRIAKTPLSLSLSLAIFSFTVCSPHASPNWRVRGSKLPCSATKKMFQTLWHWKGGLAVVWSGSQPHGSALTGMNVILYGLYWQQSTQLQLCYSKLPHPFFNGQNTASLVYMVAISNCSFSVKELSLSRSEKFNWRCN